MAIQDDFTIDYALETITHTSGIIAACMECAVNIWYK